MDHFICRCLVFISISWGFESFDISFNERAADAAGFVMHADRDGFDRRLVRCRPVQELFLLRIAKKTLGQIGPFVLWRPAKLCTIVERLPILLRFPAILYLRKVAASIH